MRVAQTMQMDGRFDRRGDDEMAGLLGAGDPQLREAGLGSVDDVTPLGAQPS
jgi:hypothetical protein